MCYPVKCSTCSKTTWGGCGSHVDSVMRSVAPSDRCECAGNSAPSGKTGFFASLFGR